MKEYRWKTVKRFGRVVRAYYFVAFEGKVVGTLERMEDGNFYASTKKLHDKYGEFVNLDAATVNMQRWIHDNDKKLEANCETE